MKILLSLLGFMFCITAQALTFVEMNQNRAVYSAASIHFVPAATATDICTLTGSATKPVKVISFKVFSNQTSAGTNQFHLIKRSTADTGGTFNTMTAIPFDSGWDAATATAVYYLANPTTGTAVGTMFVKRFATGISTSLLLPYFDFLDSKQGPAFTPIVLHGTAEQIALNFNSQAIPSGMSVGCEFVWQEN